jgi:conjugative transfer signal peptidase TraF
MSLADHCTPNHPLREWGMALRQKRLMGRRLRRVTGGMLLSTIALGLPILQHPLPRLAWNASASAPLGLYMISPDTLPNIGDMVLARVPAFIRPLAARRGYIPMGVPLIKRVAAVNGARICARDRHIFINGRLVAERLAHDAHHRPLPQWTGCRRMHRGEYFLLMAEVPASFDGRYFGAVGRQDIIGKAWLLWAR